MSRGASVRDWAPVAADPPLDGPPYFLIRVSGLYLTADGGVVGDPAKARVWTDRKLAMEKARDVRKRKLWLGKVVVVKRKNLKARQW